MTNQYNSLLLFYPCIVILFPSVRQKASDGEGILYTSKKIINETCTVGMALQRVRKQGIGKYTMFYHFNS